ncbi:hypothetical protein NQ314_006543 [Rhamnusium bicolor]|uniref:FLYWCH-type domain-containing protein n=1 Tax=Rhamnusium bicolor TaxID=1586634 RepID=A0AAV8Z0W8_9CUCU|nr:hypothetical protein NQ314_006543 [Rhamnusium bicolor]
MFNVSQETQQKRYKYEKYGYRKPQIPIGRMGKLDFGDGFLYFKKIQYTDKLYIRCAMMNEIGCKASYVISVNSDGTYKDDMRCVAPHSHPPNELAVQTEKFLNELQKAVEVMPMSTHRIYNFVAQS